MKDFSPLEKKLKISFKNKKLLLQAFVHRSFLNEKPSFKISNNERLEFLGDSVLSQVVTEYLYKKYPATSEGELTVWRAALVNAKLLSIIAQNLGFNDFILVSKGEERQEGKARQLILANSLEAFIGALYLDKGLSACQDFIKKHIIKELPGIIKSGAFRDAKSRFQEEAQDRINITPSYRVLKEWGPDHNRRFLIGVFLGEEMAAKGQGSSKHEAEEEAAKNALMMKGW